jgi:electron transport complex protein RnfC
MSNLSAGVKIREDIFLEPQKRKPASLIPDRVIIPLSQHTGKPAREIISKDQELAEGELIAEKEGYISANIHASVSGKVIDIGNYPHPVHNRCRAISIQCQGCSVNWKEKKPEEVENLSREELLNLIESAGIVGMGGAGFPTHVKLQPPAEYKIDTLIINGCECEPYLISDAVLMEQHPFQIVKGIEIISKIIKSQNVLVAIEDNKQEAILRMRQACINKNIEVIKLKTKYPRGAEKQLIQSLLNREVPPKGLPFHVGVIVQNVGTCYAVYEAVYKKKPLIERLVTITGDCIENTGVYWIRIGTLVSEIVDKLGGFKKEPAKVIFGGPMMGIAQPSLDVPVLKTTSGILFLSQERVSQFKEYPCIRCAKCIDVCPMRLLPTKIAQAAKFGNMELAAEYNAVDCMECGCCEYICPSKIPLVAYIKLGKNYILMKK